jgi:predicted O-linked N-acetylglucosamine transferase (SPINDLY family)
MIDPIYGEWLARGQAHLQAGLPIDAMLCLRQALKQNRYAVAAQFHLGEALRGMRRYDEAIAAWRAALAMQPRHVPTLLALGDVLRHYGSAADARAVYRQALAIEPRNAPARVGSALATADDAALADMRALIAERPQDFVEWNDLGTVVARIPVTGQRHELLAQIDGLGCAGHSMLLLALCAEDAAANTAFQRARELLERAAETLPPIDDPEALRWLALAAARVAAEAQWARRYAQRCVEVFAPVAPLLWPRRTAGAAIRIAYLVAPSRRLRITGADMDIDAYLKLVVAAHDRDRFDVSVFIVDDTTADAPSVKALAGIRIAIVGAAPTPVLGRALAEADFDVVIDLAGMQGATGPLLATRPARTLWTYPGMQGAHVAPLVTNTLPALATNEAHELAQHRRAIEDILVETCAKGPWFLASSTRTAAAIGAIWRSAVSAQQAGNGDVALAAYGEVLTEQPGFAAAEYLSGILMRDRGQFDAAESAFTRALAAAPRYVDARMALTNLLLERGDADAAATLCLGGIELNDGDPAPWRALGLCELARHDAAAARRAFERALALAPTDGETHYNHGVALQMLHFRDEALRAYQRALAVAPDLLAADFNIGVVFQEQGRTDAAIGAFETVLAREPRHVLAHKALGDTLLAARRIDDWLRVFARFEAACPRALSLAVQALEVYQYRGDFAGLNRYLDRLRQDDFEPESETDLADCLEQLMFVMLYFDLAPDVQLAMYRAYDTVACRVYGTPLPRAHTRRPGPLRIGYLSGDFRNHVMGKMMWEAIRHHDRTRFEIFCYAIVSDDDEVTARFRDFAKRFEVFADLTERDAAQRIVADDLDVLVDLSTHTKNAKPGILALKPARVQITHIASCGALGLSAVDFKLTDAFCDLPENQAYLLERLLPMAGCVYPYRHVAPAPEHPFHRDRLGIPQTAVVIGAFVNPLKLSQRCLSLWREVLERIPQALLAISPLSPEARAVYGRLLGAGGIALERVIVLPQGRNDAEGQARYHVVDFALDPLPYGGVNSTLEALDMGVPVVTLCGRKHGERTSYSILANLGVTQTVAESGSDYVAIALRLANDAQFTADVRAAIATGLAHSTLTDMPHHTRALEAAYELALTTIQTLPSERAPADRDRHATG